MALLSASMIRVVITSVTYVGPLATVLESEQSSLSDGAIVVMAQEHHRLPEQLPDFVKSSVKSFTKLQNKFFEFRTSIERDIGAEDLKQDIYNELKMEELERDDEQSK